MGLICFCFLLQTSFKALGMERIRGAWSGAVQLRLCEQFSCPDLSQT